MMMQVFLYIVTSSIFLKSQKLIASAQHLVEEDGKIYTLELGKPKILPCTATGGISPGQDIGLMWSRLDGKSLESRDINTLQFQNESHYQVQMVINSTQEKMRGQYICSTSSLLYPLRRLEIRAKIEIIDPKEIPTKSELGTGATIGTVLTVVVITLLGVCLCTELHRRKNRNGLSKREVELFKNGNPEGVKKGVAHEDAVYHPYDFSYELEEDSLKIDKYDILGAGSFGVVYRGRYKDKVVAIKTIKPGSDKAYLRALLCELKVMIHIGRHPFINMLVGACSKDLRRGLLNVVIEICPNGNLESYLRQNRYTFTNQFDTNGALDPKCQEIEEYPNSPIRTLDLLIWAFQIADGMEYLGNLHVIHGDLAARNILLDENRTAKITDFGLARQIYDYANYVKRNQEPLPWRWMAIESLKHLTFSEKSDVWSFGILLFELFTCGDVPYPGESWTSSFVDKLANGLRLSRPKYSSRQLYNQIMVQCWHPNPKDRITFSTLKEYFEVYVRHNSEVRGNKLEVHRSNVL